MCLFLAAFYVGFEEIGDVTDVLGLEFFLVQGRVVDEGRVEKVLGAIVMIHADVLESELDLDEVVGQVGRKLYNLVPEVLDKLVVDVRNPRLQPDRHILEQEVNALLLL